MGLFRCVVAVGIVAAVVAGCGGSGSTVRASTAARVAGPRWRVVGDVDGDGHADRARLVYLGGAGPDNWELVVDMTRLGQQAVRFTGDPVLPGNTAAPTIAGSADAEPSGRAQVFVKVTAGAST
jgi:hypothetical protein